jgi:hypothetical protein
LDEPISVSPLKEMMVKSVMICSNHNDEAFDMMPLFYERRIPPGWALLDAPRLRFSTSESKSGEMAEI